MKSEYKLIYIFFFSVVVCAFAAFFHNLTHNSALVQTLGVFKTRSPFAWIVNKTGRVETRAEKGPWNQVRHMTDTMGLMFV